MQAKQETFGFLYLDDLFGNEEEVTCREDRKVAGAGSRLPDNTRKNRLRRADHLTKRDRLPAVASFLVPFLRAIAS